MNLAARQASHFRREESGLRMNVHSQSIGMSVAPLSSHDRTNDGERRERILEAAERAFAEHGFHAATMQHVAEAAGMSAGNLYRTFSSKEAIVEGLCAPSTSRSGSRTSSARRRRGHLRGCRGRAYASISLREPRKKARLIVEIWAEAARNPASRGHTARRSMRTSSARLDASFATRQGERRGCARRRPGRRRTLHASLMSAAF